jgi:hypothetical protein
MKKSNLKYYTITALLKGMMLLVRLNAIILTYCEEAFIKFRDDGLYFIAVV